MRVEHICDTFKLNFKVALNADIGLGYRTQLIESKLVVLALTTQRKLTIMAADERRNCQRLQKNFFWLNDSTPVLHVPVMTLSERLEISYPF